MKEIFFIHYRLITKDNTFMYFQRSYKVILAIMVNNQIYMKQGDLLAWSER